MIIKSEEVDKKLEALLREALTKEDIDRLNKIIYEALKAMNEI